MKQGRRVWYKNVKVELEKMGYTCTEVDHTVFVHFRDNTISIIVLYVDDFTLVCRDINLITADKKALIEAYNMTDLGEIAYILGIHVIRDREAEQITLLQQKYIKEILEQFRKSDVRPISTPMLTNEHLTKLQSPKIDMKSCQHALGALIYPMLGTYLDLTYAVGALRRHAATPGKEHRQALESVFCYLQATKDWCLVFQ